MWLTNADRPHFTALCFTALHRYHASYKLKVCGNPTLNKSVSTIFPAAFAHSVSIGQFSSVQSLSHIWLFVTPWTAAHQAFLSITNSWSFLKLMSIKSEMPSNHLILCRPLLILLSISPSIMVFYNKSVLRIMWPKYCSFSFSISPSNEHPGLISFTTDLDDVLAVQGILKSLLKHHS